MSFSSTKGFESKTATPRKLGEPKKIGRTQVGSNETSRGESSS